MLRPGSMGLPRPFKSPMSGISERIWPTVSRRCWLAVGTRIRRGLHVQATPEQGEAEPIPEEERHPARSRSEEQARVARRAQKLDRYTQIIEFHEQGLPA